MRDDFLFFVFVLKISTNAFYLCLVLISTEGTEQLQRQKMGGMKMGRADVEDGHEVNIFCYLFYI